MLEEAKSIRNLPIEGKRVIIRVDYNVPCDEKGIILDTRKIKSSLPTLKYSIEKKAKIILISHWGRPKGKYEERYSLLPIKYELERLVGKKIIFSQSLDIGEETEKLIAELKEGDILLLENIRFHPGEEENSPELSQRLASLGDIFINDAFSVSHRAHASVVGITNFISSFGYGLSLEEEIRHLSPLLISPEKPFVLILGGKKVTTKINTIINLLPKIDIMLIGGLMAYVFLAAQGDSIGATEIEADEEKKKKEIEEAFRIMEESKKYNVPIILPHYHVAIDEMRNIVDVFTHIPPGYKGVDIGEATINTFCKHISKAKTILWNGPLGMVEDPRFMYGSKRIAEYIANLPPEVTRIACGGDTDTVIDNLQLAPKFTYVSTAGGAMLEFLEGKNLPGLVPFLVS